MTTESESARKGGSPNWLFLHIPKTAGTSIITALHNIFGDRNVYRVTWANFARKTDLGDQLREASETHAAVIGHVHFPFWEPLLDGAHAFTVLREPVERVLSLYRFIRTRPADELSRFELDSDVSMEQFLACEHPGIWRQVNNGMCDFLGSTRERINNPPIDDLDALLERALANLARLNVAFTDNLAEVLGRWAQNWGVPYPLRLARENVTQGGENDGTISQAVRDEIAARNTLDLTLYRTARERFGRHPDLAESLALDARALFRIAPGPARPVAEIPGRMGFQSTDGKPVAWIPGGQSGEIHGLSEARAMNVELELLAPVDNYPPARVEVSVNGGTIRPQVRRDGGRSFTLTAEAVRFRSGLNRITVTPGGPPQPAGATERAPLGVALASVRFG